MARQRFIHPSIWQDPVFGRLTGDEQVMFIGLFSIADDEGRLLADPAHLRGELFRFKSFSVARVKKLRDSVTAQCANVHLYRANGVEYIAMLKWRDHQKPKYPSPSKVPAPAVDTALDSPNVPPTFPETSTKTSPLDREGLGRDRVGKGRVEKGHASDVQFEAERIAACCELEEKDSEQRALIRLLAAGGNLPVGAFAKVRESCEHMHPRPGIGYAVNALKSELAAREAVA